VTLWATWCEACEKEIDALNRLQARTEGRDLVIIGVAVGDGRAAVADFAQRRGLRYVNFVDEDFHFVDALGERTVPATLILDRQGRIVFRGKALDGASLAALQRTLDDGR
jgi:peroxiredoxin